jgi:type I restriction enzyme S subunit
MALHTQLAAAEALPVAFVREVFGNSQAEKWPLVPLGRFARLSSGATPSRGVAKYFSGDIPWVKTLDLNCGEVSVTAERISKDAFEDVRAELLPRGTVMVAMYGGSGTIGKSGILGIPATTNQAICSVLPDIDVFDSAFLHFYFISIRPVWMKHSAGNRKDPNINKSVVAQMKCPLPSVPTQRCISTALRNRVSRAERVVARIEEQLMVLESLRCALMRAPRTFSREAYA